MDAASFSTGQGCPVEKPRNPTAHLEGRRPGRRVIRGAFSFGYFSLGKQRKVTRPPAGGRKPAAGEPGRDYATTRDGGSGRPAFGYWRTPPALAPFLGYAGMTIKTYPAPGSHQSHTHPTATTFAPQFPVTDLTLAHRSKTIRPLPGVTPHVASVLSTQGIWTFTLVATSTSASIGCRHCITS